MSVIERICRLICQSKGIDPDGVGYGQGYSMPSGSTYKLWEAQIKTAETILVYLKNDGLV